MRVADYCCMFWIFVYLPPFILKYTVVRKDFGSGPAHFASSACVRNVLRWWLLPTSCLPSLHLGPFPKRCGDQTDHETVAMASNPISRPSSSDGNPENRQILQPSSPSGQTCLAIVLIRLKMKRLHQRVCRRFQHSCPRITGGGAWQQICLLIGMPSSRGGPGGKQMWEAWNRRCALLSWRIPSSSFSPDVVWWRPQKK